MRKILLVLLLGSAVVAAVPTVAMASSHRDRGHHRRHRHAPAHHEHFGSWNDAASVPNNAPDAGTIASFDNGVLTIKLGDGSMVSGQVTNDTEIRCEAMDAGEMENHEHGDGDHGGGNDTGNRGGDDNGDDNGRGDDEQGEEMCSTANLVPGTGVFDAELTISRSGSVWNEVDLAG